MGKTNRYLGAILNYLYNDIIANVPSHFLRKLFLRCFNKSISKECIILRRVKFYNFWNIEIGAHSIINQGCVLDCRRYSIIIGENVDVGPYTKIWTLGHDPDDNGHGLYGGRVELHDHVWVASSVTILPNISLGKGAVVAAGSVVVRDVQKKEIVAGNPARVIRKRNNSLNYIIKFSPLLE